MCTRPILIKNPNRGCGHLGRNRFKDCESAYIPVPCGHCVQCYSRRQTDLVQRIEMMLPFFHPFFFTLTYKSDMLPVFVCPDGEHEIRYADMRDLTLMLKRIRKDNLLGRPFKYFIVSELGSLRGRPHFHGILLVAKLSSDTYNDCLSMQEKYKKVFLMNWKRNIGTSLHPDWKDLCIPKEYWIAGKHHGTFDFQYCLTNSNRSIDSISFYVTKYCLKPSKHERSLQSALKLNYDPEVYKDIWNVVKPRAQWSKGFGLRDMNSVQAALSSLVNFSAANGDEFPKFFQKDSGRSFPLAKYYKTTSIIPDSLQEVFFARHCLAHGTIDGFIETPDRDPIRTEQETADLRKMQNFIDNRADLFSFLDF